MTEALKASPVEIGILYAVTGLSSGFTLLIARMLAGKYDRKKIMIAGWIGWMPAPLIFSIAENWMEWASNQQYPPR
jgi:MFS family permease